MIKCNKCSKVIPDNVVYCPYCGKRMQNQIPLSSIPNPTPTYTPTKKTYTSKGFYKITALFLLAIIILLIFTTFGNIQKMAIPSVSNPVSQIPVTAPITTSSLHTTTPTSSLSFVGEKNLGIGETWDVGGGYTIRAQSIDRKANPLLVWLTLSKNGNKLDDKEAKLGETYSYQDIFRTKIAEINIGPPESIKLTDTYIESSSSQTTSSLTLTPSLKKLNVVTEAFNNNLAAAVASGLERTGAGQAFENGYYYVVDWQGDKYVTVNGKIDKLSKLILEQRKILKSDGTLDRIEKKTLTAGETWDIGNGWTLTAMSIDAKASPRQAWLTLSKDGIKKDNKVLAQGQIYTYVEKNIAGEMDIPLLVTYIDSIFAGATSDMVQFKYTWVISSDVTIIKVGDKYNDLEVVAVDKINRRIELKSYKSITSQTSTHLPVTPKLVFKGTESYAGSDGKQYMRYKLAIENWNAFPAELFEPAPDLPPCGLNKNAARTWVNIYSTKGDSYIYGFCALPSPQYLNSIWFAVAQGVSPPEGVYVVLTDRRKGITYRSNVLSLSKSSTDIDIVPTTYLSYVTYVRGVTQM